MPRRVLMDDFPQYLPFVNRERQVADCVSHFAKAFTAAYDTETGQHEMMDHKDEDGDDGDDDDDDEDVYGTRNPAQEAARKNYKMVIAAGGPGIGQPLPHAPSVQQVRAKLRDMLELTAPCLSVVCCARQDDVGPLRFRCCWERLRYITGRAVPQQPAGHTPTPGHVPHLVRGHL